MRHQGRPAGLPLVAGVLAAGLLVGLAPLGRAALVDAASWIDAPLDGSLLPLAPRTVIAHSTDPSGVDQVVLDATGTVVPQQGAHGERLATTRFLWTPPGPGTYLLVVQARGRSGALGAPAVATVIVTDRLPPPATPTAEPPGSSSPGISPAPSSSPGSRPSPKPTRTPAPTRTPPPCSPPAPVLVFPDDRAVLDTPQPTFEWLYREPPACQPTQFRVEIVDVDGSFSAPLITGTVPASQFFWTVGQELDPCIVFMWRVRAVNHGVAGPASEVRTFRITARTCP